MKEKTEITETKKYKKTIEKDDKFFKTFAELDITRQKSEKTKIKLKCVIL